MFQAVLHFLYLKRHPHQEVVEHTFNPSIWEAKAGESEASLVYRVLGQPRLHRETLSEEAKGQK